MTGSIRIFEKSNFTPKLSVLVFLKVKLPNIFYVFVLDDIEFEVFIQGVRNIAGSQEKIRF